MAGGKRGRSGSTTKPSTIDDYKGSGKRKGTKRYNAAPLATRGFQPRFGSDEEKKFFDTDPADHAAWSTATQTLMFVPVEGAEYNQREGRKCRVKSFYVKGHVEVTATKAANVGTPITVGSQMGRLIICLDMQPNGSAFAMSDLLEDPADPASQLNPNNRYRFLILKDKEYVFDPVTISATLGNSWTKTMYPIKIFKPLDFDVIFNSNSVGNIGDIQTGALWMVWMGSNSSAATGAVAHVSTRVRYTDA